MAKRLAFDKVLFTLVIVLVGLGLTMVFSSSAAIARRGGQGMNLFLVKQCLAAVVGLVGMIVAMHVDYRHLRRPAVAYGLLAGAMVLLVVVLFGPEVNGTRRWLFIGGLSMQPSELAKLAVIPFLAFVIDRKSERRGDAELLIPSLLALGIVAALVVIEPDLGTAFLILVAGLLMLFLAGVRWSFFIAGALALAPLLWFLIDLVPYRRQRLMVFLNPEADPLGAGYQALQSLIAVGSGGVMGLGLGNSAQKLHFLPHPHSDFIYSILTEELGMIGGVTVLLLLALLLWRGARAGARAPDALGRSLAWGFTGLIVLQSLIHIGVALSLMPTKGMPMPFISYGGTALVVSMTACGAVLNVSQHG